MNNYLSLILFLFTIAACAPRESQKVDNLLTVNDAQFDWGRNQQLVNMFRKWGFGRILSYPNSNSRILDNTVRRRFHDNHGHIEGFSPNWKSN